MKQSINDADADVDDGDNRKHWKLVYFLDGSDGQWAYEYPKPIKVHVVRVTSFNKKNKPNI